jgi:hypothetical protein
MVGVVLCRRVFSNINFMSDAIAVFDFGLERNNFGKEKG